MGLGKELLRMGLKAQFERLHLGDCQTGSQQVQSEDKLKEMHHQRPPIRVDSMPIETYCTGNWFNR